MTSRRIMMNSINKNISGNPNVDWVTYIVNI